MRAAPTIPCPAPDTMPPANDVPTPHVMTIQIDDAAPATYAYYGEPEAGPAQPRDQRRRLRRVLLDPHLVDGAHFVGRQAVVVIVVVGVELGLQTGKEFGPGEDAIMVGVVAHQRRRG